MNVFKPASTTLATLAFIFLGCGPGLAKKWDYQYRISAEGTRSEHLVGSLTFDKKALPQALGRVVTPIGEFIYLDEAARGFPPQTNWVPCRTEADGSLTTGYYSKTGRELLAAKSLRKTSIASGSNQKITDSQLKVGYYPASFHTRLEGTPSDWFYSVTLSLWVNPEKIGDALKQNRQTPAAAL